MPKITKEKNKEYKKKRAEKIKNWFTAYREGLSCTFCGENHVACICFHHKDPSQKIMGVPKMVDKGFSISTITTEIAKCEILCHNCHAKLHGENKNAG